MQSQLRNASSSCVLLCIEGLARPGGPFFRPWHADTATQKPRSNRKNGHIGHQLPWLAHGNCSIIRCVSSFVITRSLESIFRPFLVTTLTFGGSAFSTVILTSGISASDCLVTLGLASAPLQENYKADFEFGALSTINSPQSTNLPACGRRGGSWRRCPRPGTDCS